MGTSLTGLTPATTYDALIKVGDNGPITASLKILSDGLGNNLPMEASSSTINFTGTLQQSGTAVPTAAQVNAKQDALVSGTNIKTINGTSVLGSGNIVTPTTSPSGVSGAIQFSNGSAFASDAANFFWDDTNNRLGIGTNAPTASIHATTFKSSSINDNGTVLQFLPSYNTFTLSKLAIGAGDFNSQLGVKGYGSTSATTSLLVQNSAGSTALQVFDNQDTRLYGALAFINGNTFIFNNSNTLEIAAVNGATSDLHMIPARQMNINNTGSYTAQAGAILQVDSTTKGFLPPRMTTTQKNAIASPAAGLVVYDSTTNKLCCYNGSTWNDLF